jgi:uncharacterized membrane protein YbhN (UPF0104 family)
MSGAIGFVLLTYIGRVIRWRVMLRPLQPHPGFWNLLVATIIGFTAIVLLGRPGELVRPYLIAIKEKVPFSSQIAAWLLERIYDLLVVLVIFGFALSRLEGSAMAESAGPGLTWVMQVGGEAVWIIGALCLVALIAFGRFSDLLRRRIMAAVSFLPDKARLKVFEFVTTFTQGTESTRSYGAVALLLLYTTLEWLLIVGCYYCLFQSLPETKRFTIIQVLAFLGFTSFGSIVQIPGVGGGMQVVAALVLTELFGLKLETATGIAIIMWLTTFVIIVPLGLVLAFHEGIRWSALRHLESDPST